MAIKQIFSSKSSSPTETKNMISSAWFRGWKNSVGYDCSPTCTFIPPIDNAPLLSKTGQLRKGLTRGYDYEIITNEAWLLLKKWHGGGPELPLALDHDPLQNLGVSVIPPMSFQIEFRNQRKPIYIAKSKSVAELKGLATQAFQVDPSEILLCETWPDGSCTPIDEKRVLSELCFKRGEILILKYIHDCASPLPIPSSPPRRRDSSAIAPPKPHDSPVIAPAKYEHPVPVKAPPPLDKVEIGFSGLINFGNTCFLNSAIQCLIHTAPFVEYFISGSYKRDLNLVNPFGTKCQITNAIVELIRDLWDSGLTTVSPRSLVYAVARYIPHFRGFAQQDAHEFLVLLLDLINEDLNRAMDKSNGKQIRALTVDETEKDEQLLADQVWSRHRSRNDSIVVDLFHGLFRSEMTCPDCQSKCFIFEPFVTLSLAIPGAAYNTPRFLFVPYDPCQSRFKMTLQLQFGYDPGTFRRMLNAELGRNFEVGFATYAGGSFEWHVSPPVDTPRDRLIVFEIPDVRARYSVAYVCVKKKGFWYDWDDSMNHFILLPVSSASPTIADVQNVALTRLSYLWNMEDDPDERTTVMRETPKIVAFMDSLRPIDSRDKVVAEFDREIPVHARMPFSATFSVRLRLNPKFMNSNVGFKWNRLIAEPSERKCNVTEAMAPTLENCLRQFCDGAILDDANKWFCPSCRQPVNARKRLDIWRGPKILIVHFKRFGQGRFGFHKLDTDVKYPDLLDLAPFVVGGTAPKYSLFGVCEHFGGSEGGHYVAHVKGGKENRWHFLNDSSSRVSDPQSAHNGAAYILFYEQNQ